MMNRPFIFTIHCSSGHGAGMTASCGYMAAKAASLSPDLAPQPAIGNSFSFPRLMCGSQRNAGSKRRITESSMCARVPGFCKQSATGCKECFAGICNPCESMPIVQHAFAISGIAPRSRQSAATLDDKSKRKRIEYFHTCFQPPVWPADVAAWRLGGRMRRRGRRRKRIKHRCRLGGSLGHRSGRRIGHRFGERYDRSRTLAGESRDGGQFRDPGAVGNHQRSDIGCYR